MKKKNYGCGSSNSSVEHTALFAVLETGVVNGDGVTDGPGAGSGTVTAKTTRTKTT